MINHIHKLCRNILQPQPQWVLELDARRGLGIVFIGIIINVKAKVLNYFIRFKAFSAGLRRH